MVVEIPAVRRSMTPTGPTVDILVLTIPVLHGMAVTSAATAMMSKSVRILISQRHEHHPDASGPAFMST